VLCQQSLDPAVGHTLEQFEAFVASATERELRQAREKFSQLRKSLKELKIAEDAVEETIKEIRIDDEDLSDSVTTALASNSARRDAVTATLSSEADLPSDTAALISVSSEVDALAHQLEERVRTLRAPPADGSKARITVEAQEFRRPGHTVQK
jgi:septal ring factor EnvC (AmiA/AmiB activator)